MLVYTEHMSEHEFPDVLGYITGGTRLTINGVQIALAVRPPVVRAGGAFHAVLLAQNMLAVPATLSGALNLPGRDFRRQGGYFAVTKEPVQIQLRPGEVGSMLLPALSHPDTPPADQYKLGVSVSVKPLAQPRPARPDSGGTPIQLDRLSEKRQQMLDRLHQLEYSVNKRLRLHDELEAAFKVVPGVERDAPPKGGWVSLWNLAEDGTLPQLLAHYGPVLKEQVFPRLKRDVVFDPLCQATEARFKAAGYPLKPLEAMYIAKLLALVVHMADPGEDSFDYLGSQHFNVTSWFKSTDGAPVRLPRWFEGLVRGIAYDEQILQNVPGYIATRVYDSLLRDTIPFAFRMIQNITGEDMGTDEETRDYADKFIQLLKAENRMDFAHAYLPLVMGGVIVFDRVIAPGEVLEDTLRGMSEVLAMRDAEWSDDNDLVFLMTKELVNRSLRLFGFQI